MISFDTIVKGFPDKKDYPNTTSLKFKKDLYNFFFDSKFRDVKALEIGSHRGHTTKVMSHLFKEVITMNINPKGDDWIPVNRENIKYIVNDVYNGRPWHTSVSNDVLDDYFYDIEVIFLDGLRGYENVKMDLAQAIQLQPRNKKKYIIIQDYGNAKFDGVKHAVDEVCWWGHMEIVKGIGYPVGTEHGTMKYEDWEAVICQTKELK
jgi:hypothetical protein